jgi:ketosteroid isomerase-like protein
MMALWAQGPATVLLNPRDKEAAIGSEAVKKNWQETMGAWKSLKVSAKGTTTIQVNGNTAYRFTPEQAAGKFKTGKEGTFVALATTTFEKRGNDWLITTHHASTMPS